MPIQASWISGSAAQAARQGYFISQVRDGFGSRFCTYGKEWFFFPIPTPVLVSGHRARLSVVFVMYKTNGTARIEAIHIDDGRKKVKIINTNVSGAHDETIVDGQNRWAITPPVDMIYGVNLGVYVDFGPQTQAGVPYIEFVAAGADFQID